MLTFSLLAPTKLKIMAYEQIFRDMPYMLDPAVIECNKGKLKIELQVQADINRLLRLGDLPEVSPVQTLEKFVSRLTGRPFIFPSSVRENIPLLVGSLTSSSSSSSSSGSGSGSGGRSTETSRRSSRRSTSTRRPKTRSSTKKRRRKSEVEQLQEAWFS